MTLIAAVRVVRFFFGLALLWSLYYLSVRALLLDSLRQKLFAIRDGLFDFAADGGIDFEDQNYRELRNDINSLIRFADRLSFLRLLLAPLVISGDDPNMLSFHAWSERVSHLDPLVRKKLLDTRESALREMMLYIIRRSLILHATFWLLTLIGLFVDTIRRFNQRLPKYAESLEAQARYEYPSAA